MNAADAGCLRLLALILALILASILEPGAALSSGRAGDGRHGDTATLQYGDAAIRRYRDMATRRH